ncbi:MAG: VWA domain-containing protein [bacterium]
MPIAGTACVAGTFADGDQDVFLWTVSAADAAERWAVDLNGIPGQQTKFQLHRLEEPATGGAPAVVGPALLEIATSPGDSHAASDDVFVAAGTYVIGLSVSGGAGPYRLRLGRAAAVERVETEPNDDPVHATPVAGAFAVRGDLAASEDVFAWNLDGVSAAQRWSIGASGPLGGRLALTLTDGSGRVLATASGGGAEPLSLPDLGLDPGTWVVRLGPAAGASAPYVLRAVTAGPRVPGREEEPNDDVAHARPIALGRAVAGRIAVDGDVDCYAFAGNASLAEKRLEVALDSPGRSFRKLCLVDAAGVERTCRAGISPRLSDLVLAPAPYALCVSGTRDPRSTYSLAVNLAGRRQPDGEAEPNDASADANPLPANGAVHGRWVGAETDAFRLDVTGEPKLWKATLSAPGEIRILDGRSGVEAQRKAAPAAPDVEIADLFLLPGPHVVEVAGENASYDLHVEATGVPDPMAEREPNDRPAQAQRIRFGETRKGVLEGSDRDSYRFSLAAEEHVTLRLEPAPAADVRFTLDWSAPSVERPTAIARGEPLVYDALLAPGDYVVALTTEGSSAGDYSLSLERRDPFDVAVDQEPNDIPGQARPVPASFEIRGSVGEWKDSDYYALPRVAVATEVRVRATGDVELELSENGVPLPSRVSAGALEGTLPPDHVVALAVRGEGAYTASLRFEPGPAPATASASAGLAVALELDSSAALAYGVRAQRVTGSVALANSSQRPIDLRLEAAASHFALVPTLARGAVRLAPGARERVPIAVEIGADAWADPAAQIAVRALAADGNARSATARLALAGDAAPVGEHPFAPLPPALLGGWNLAWSALGSRVLAAPGDDDASAQALLFDELTSTAGFARPAAALPFDTTVAFAGDRAWPVAGVVLDPEIPGGLAMAERLRDFELWLAEDGEHFERVLSGSLSPLSIEQPFVLDRVRPARAARLRWLSNQARQQGDVGPAALGLGEWRVGLGEWKVVAPPGEPAGVSLDVAERSRGGHVVRAVPTLGRAPDVAEGLFEAGGYPAVEEIEKGARPELVIGFHEDRAAQLTSLEWVEASSSSSELRFTSFDVSVSEQSPLGPWRAIGPWKLERDAKGVASFRFPQPEWARFVRLLASAPLTSGGKYAYPVTLRALERANDASYRSILGEWGHLGRDAIREALAAPPPKRAELPAGEATSRDRPRTLALGEEIAAQALVGERDGWFRVDVPAGKNTLTLHVTGAPTVDVDVSVEDVTGAPVTLRSSWGGPAELMLEADAEPGHGYLVHVVEPPRSVAIAYDTSLSLAAYTPLILRGLEAFAAGVRPGVEAVNFLPFERPFLMESWSDQPFALLAALAKLDAENPSSALEKTVAEAARALAERRGSRALLVLTDAATPGYLDQEAQWAMVASARPRIFASHIGADADPIREKQLLQDLAAVNGGVYVSARTQAEMDTSFERVAAWLRRPARYRLMAEARNQAPLEPGTLVVTTRAAAPPAVGVPRPTAAIELILDASGSMLGRMEGRRRIEIARAVLGELVTRNLPPATPLALRVFGDDRPGSCETRLAQPLAPVDAPALVKRIGAVQPQNLARTPIAASLAKVAEDLRDASGPRTVVLVTDGEETCGGDPRAEIQALVAAGIDVRVNIVGFAVADAELTQTFEAWAREGHGRYFPAGTSSALEAALRAAVRAPFQVFGESGALAASGVVDGDAVTLPAGRYRVVVGGRGDGASPAAGAAAPTAFEAVVVEPARKTELTWTSPLGG